MPEPSRQRSPSWPGPAPDCLDLIQPIHTLGVRHTTSIASDRRRSVVGRPPTGLGELPTSADLCQKRHLGGWGADEPAADDGDLPAIAQRGALPSPRARALGVAGEGGRVVEVIDWSRPELFEGVGL